MPANGSFAAEARSAAVAAIAAAFAAKSAPFSIAVRVAASSRSMLTRTRSSTPTAGCTCAVPVVADSHSRLLYQPAKNAANAAVDASTMTVSARPAMPATLPLPPHPSRTAEWVIPPICRPDHAPSLGLLKNGARRGRNRWRSRRSPCFPHPTTAERATRGKRPAGCASTARLSPPSRDLVAGGGRSLRHGSPPPRGMVTL